MQADKMELAVERSGNGLRPLPRPWLSLLWVVGVLAASMFPLVRRLLARWTG